MRRKIGIAVRRQTEPSTQSTQAFNAWLDRKRREKSKLSELDQDSSEDETNGVQSSKSVEGSEAYEEWMKQKKIADAAGKPERPRTGKRPIPGLVQVGSTDVGDGTSHEQHKYHMAYRDYSDSRRKKPPKFERMRTVDDFMSEKRKLEERRQKLLLTAITYEEWLEQNDDRKTLIRRILKADTDEMKKLENDSLRRRNNGKSQTVFEVSGSSFNQSSDDPKKIPTGASIRCHKPDKEIWRRDLVGSSKSQPELAIRPERQKSSLQQQTSGVAERRKKSGRYSTWIPPNNSRNERDHIADQLRKERDLLEMLRERRMGTLVPSYS